MSDSSSYQDAVNWRPERPCREEVRAVIAYIRDQLTAEGIPFAAEQDAEENPDCWMIVAQDPAGFENMALISWSPEDARVVYAGFKPEVARRDELEGIGEDESLCWWSPQTARQCALHLNGSVREIVEEFQREVWRQADAGAGESAPNDGAQAA